MSLQEIDENVKKLLEMKEKEEAEVASKSKKKLKPFRLPRKANSNAKKNIKLGKTLAVILKNNKTIDFQWIVNFGGITEISPYSVCSYEEGAVYTYNNKIPVVVIPEWRLTPVGGVVEEAERKGDIRIPSKLFGGQSDILISNALNIGSAGQQTIIRAIEKKEADMVNKKKGNYGWLIWVAVGVVGIYVLSKVLGWM